MRCRQGWRIGSRILLLAYKIIWFVRVKGIDLFVSLFGVGELHCVDKMWSRWFSRVHVIGRGNCDGGAAITGQRLFVWVMICVVCDFLLYFTNCDATAYCCSAWTFGCTQNDALQQWLLELDFQQFFMVDIDSWCYRWWQCGSSSIHIHSRRQFSIANASATLMTTHDITGCYWWWRRWWWWWRRRWCKWFWFYFFQITIKCSANIKQIEIDERFVASPFSLTASFL